MGYLTKRLALSLATLWLLSVLIFVGAQVLPGNVGRAMLGPFADQRAVEVLNHEMGTDRPLLIQYTDWIGGLATGDLGQSYAYHAPVAPFLRIALLNSGKLALVAFLMVVPLGILGGVLAALYLDQSLDRTLTVVGLSATVVPEFVSGIVLILIFGVWLRWLPISATSPRDAGFFLPALSSAPAVDPTGTRAVRLYRTHGARRDDGAVDAATPAPPS